VKFFLQFIICILLFCGLQGSFTQSILRVCMGKSNVSRCSLGGGYIMFLGMKV
jgi:hypothetical protein